MKTNIGHAEYTEDNARLSIIIHEVTRNRTQKKPPSDSRVIIGKLTHGKGTYGNVNLTRISNAHCSSMKVVAIM